MVYNSLTRTKCRFIPMNPGKVTWYQCGPTVYDVSHVGHARTYVSLDIIRGIVRKFLGYNVVLCQNITDIDDKIIMRSSEQKIGFRDLAQKFETEFLEDMKLLGVQLPDVMTRVSEYVPEIVEYISVLVKKGLAYESNGSVYFDTAAFQAAGHKYGKLKPESVGNSELLAEGEVSTLLSNFPSLILLDQLSLLMFEYFRELCAEVRQKRSQPLIFHCGNVPRIIV